MKKNRGTGQTSQTGQKVQPEEKGAETVTMAGQVLDLVRQYLPEDKYHELEWQAFCQG